MSRHARRAEGVTSITFGVPAELKRKLEELAKNDDRKLSDYLRVQLKKLAATDAAATSEAVVKKPAKKAAAIGKVPFNAAIHAGMSTHVRQADVGKLTGSERDRKARDASA
ncbi:MAG: hypothetical protein IPL39_16130 [Opitutaceae bacterium]|nr:hypothetical protein [Opitutaceae bacterium]